MNIDMSQKKNCKCKIILFKSLIFNEYVISKIHCIYIYKLEYSVICRTIRRTSLLSFFI